jgi:PAT family beta-lactamase induction signal transducer AmpG
MEFLTSIGASKTQISSTSLLHFTGTFKFAWSPVVDLFGRKRTWVWVMQLLLGLGMFAVAAVVPGRRLPLFWTVLTIFAVLHATHDIACDGFYLQALSRTDQALFSGSRNAAFRVAMWVGKSLLVILAGVTSWFWGFAAAGALMITVALINAVVMPWPPKALPAAAPARPLAAPSASKGAAFKEAYRSFLTQPQAGLVLSFMFAHRLGDIMMFAMATPLLNDIGIGTKLRGVLTTFSTFGFMSGSIVGGALIARLGIARCLVPMTYVQNLAIPLYIGLAVVKPGFWGVLPIVVAEQLASGIGTAANSVFLMQRCRAAFSASHFAFATSVVSLASVLSGFASGPINQAVGHPWFFTIAFMASWPSLILVLLVPKTQVDAVRATTS